MTTPQRWMILGGLAVFLLGLGFGVVHTFLVDHETLLRVKEDYRSAFMAAAEGKDGEAQVALEEAKTANYNFVRSIDTHTHLLKMASVVILIGLILPLVSWTEKTKLALALALLGSAVIFPLGVFGEIFSHSLFPQAVAAGGALLAIGSFSLILFGIFSDTRR